ncbi:acyl-CoA thioesterase [Ruegeria aquimaris]|uniref:Acyl-CoA thioesterase n=1 Tax=Ruegeria aquimaris TaxID=2984333 RepID=A0ABT3AGQ1_9RHOB|nr:thioesterase family protein [Ruegeria sp. XHP0148]MCV2887839.1 acyl-CoA thioesterase [Ruegeria sp. XHP0148]
MSFSTEIEVRFKHCDPAGIVFFPRYFEMINDVVEDWFATDLGLPFHELVKENGAPTAQIQATFTAPSLHGDVLSFRLTPTRIGNSSLDYELTAHCGDELRLRAKATLVHVARLGRSLAWPQAIRERVSAQIASA